MEQKKTFEPFERIIVKEKNNKHSVWSCDMVSLATDYALYTFCRGEVKLRYYDILPFAGNEHLVGTSDMPEEEVELKDGDVLVLFDDIEMIDLDRFGFCISKYSRIAFNVIVDYKGIHWLYCVPFSKFNPYNMEETRKHILCVKDGKLVKARV